MPTGKSTALNVHIRKRKKAYNQLSQLPSLDSRERRAFNPQINTMKKIIKNGNQCNRKWKNNRETKMT